MFREYRNSESSEQGVTSDDSQEMRFFATSPPDRFKRMVSIDATIGYFKGGPIFLLKKNKQIS